MDKQTKAFFRAQFKKAKKAFGPGTPTYERRMKKRRRKSRKKNPSFELLNEDEFTELQRVAGAMFNEMVRRMNAKHRDAARKLRDNKSKLLVRAVYLISGEDLDLTQRFYATLEDDPRDEVPWQWLGLAEPPKRVMITVPFSDRDNLRVFVQQLDQLMELRAQGEWKEEEEYNFGLPALRQILDEATWEAREFGTEVKMLDNEESYAILTEVRELLDSYLESVEGDESVDEFTVVLHNTSRDLARFFGEIPEDDTALNALEDAERLARLDEEYASATEDARSILIALRAAIREGQREMLRTKRARDLETYFARKYPDEYPEGVLSLYRPVLSTTDSLRIGNREVSGIFQVKVPFFPDKRRPVFAPPFTPAAERGRKDYYASPYSSDFGPREEQDSMLVSVIYMNEAFPALALQLLDASEAGVRDLYLISAQGWEYDREAGESRPVTRLIYGKTISEYAAMLNPRRYTAAYDEDAKSELGSFAALGPEGMKLDYPFLTTLSAVEIVVTDLVKNRLTYNKFFEEGTVRYVNPSRRKRRGRRENPSLVLPIAYALTSAVGLGASLYELNSTIKANRRGG